MTDDVLLRVPVPYRAVAAPPRGRTFSPHLMRAEVDVAVRSVSDAEAPIVIEALWEAGEPSRMTWRHLDGALWRPLVGEGGVAMTMPGAFTERFAPGAAPVTDTRWQDYPFTLHAPGERCHGHLPFGGMTVLERGSRIERDDRHEAVARAQATAANDLLLVEGVLHRRSVAPVWSVCRSRVVSDPGSVFLAMPDLAKRGEGYASFALDRREDAVAFAAMVVERVAGFGYPRLIEAGHGDFGVVVEGAAVEFDAMAFGDERRRSYLRAMIPVDEGLAVGRFSEFSRPFRKAYGDLGDAVDTIARVTDGDGAEAAMDAAGRALAAMVAAEDPMWPHTWPRVGDVMDHVRLQAWRHEFEAGRADLERDMEAVAGLGA